MKIKCKNCACDIKSETTTTKIGICPICGCDTLEEISLKKIVFEALGEVSAVFMSKEERRIDIVMPTDELERIGNKLVDSINLINK